MSKVKLNKEQCISCQQCVTACPFDAIDFINQEIIINDNCRLCSACTKVCPVNALSMPQVQRETINKKEYRNALIYAEHYQGKIKPVTFELIGEANRLMNKIKQQVEVIIIGHQVEHLVEELRHYPVQAIHVYDHPDLKNFKVDAYADCFEQVIQKYKPSVVLVGATSLGRALAPRVATRFKTGLTADCTELQMKENSDLVQIRPAFGGNIMAQIITSNHRPQFATVRYKVMEAEKPIKEAYAQIIPHKIEDVQSKIDILDIHEKKQSQDLSLSDFILVAGAGVKDEKGLKLTQDLAQALGATFAVTRPLVQANLAPHQLQVGLSGQTIKPKTLITVGVSGAIQFTAGAAQSEHIIAINNDPKAPIFDIAHTHVIEDLNTLIPALLERIEKTNV